MTEVKCRVESCYYWGSGDVCKADTILVDNNIGQRTGLMEAGDLTVGATTRGRTRDFEAGNLTPGTPGNVQAQGGTRTSPGKTDVLAKTSHETLCSTFRPKNTEPKR